MDTCIGGVECVCIAMVDVDVSGIAPVEVGAEYDGFVVVPEIGETEATESGVVCIGVSGVILDVSDVECVGAIDVG